MPPQDCLHHGLVACRWASLPSHCAQPLRGQPNRLLLSGGHPEARGRLPTRRNNGRRRRLPRGITLDVVRLSARLLARLHTPAALPEFCTYQRVPPTMLKQAIQEQ